MATRSASEWCDCADAPLFTRGAATLLDHPGGCEFPAGTCTVRASRVTVHAGCAHRDADALLRLADARVV